MLMPFPSSQMQVLVKNIEGANLVSKPGKARVFHVLFSGAVQEHGTPSCTPAGREHRGRAGSLEMGNEGRG